METDNTNQQILPVQNIEQPQSSSTSGFSRTLFFITGAIFLGIGAAGGYYLGKSNQSLPSQHANKPPQSYPTPTDTAPPIDTSNYTFRLIGDLCNKESCLFTNKYNDLGGFGKLQGYVHQGQKTALGQTKMCDTLIVSGGNDTLIKHLREVVNEGNSINRFDENNNLIVTLNLADVDNTDKNIIQSSSISNPVELEVIRIVEGGRNAPVCYSFIEIISAKTLK